MKHLKAVLLQTVLVCAVVLSAGTVSAQNWSITDNLNGDQSGENRWDAWILGTNEPENASGTRGDGTIGPYVHVPVGTSPFYYEYMDEGEGEIVMWINDPGNCLEATNPGYPNGGPMWGLQTSGYASVCVGIGRANYVAGCQGYQAWSSADPYAFLWFKDGLRASHDHPFTAGWYKWTLAGGWDDISFTLHDVTYEIQDGAPHDDDTFGDCTRTYDASTRSEWEAIFGDGWNALYVRGDGAGGVEPIDIQVTAGSGIFNAGAVSSGYTSAGWNTVKQLFR